MRYVSTRGQAPALDFEEVLLAGLARDGGLYVPESWPQMSADDMAALAGLPYAEVALRVMRPFVGGALDADAFAEIVHDAYAGFRHRAVAPLRQLGGDEWLLELFHGPTFAFKDLALQLLGRLFDHVLAKHKSRLTIVVATSGDTGSAAIEACRGRDALRIFVLHPQGRVSDVQRRQMTTVAQDNVHNLAIEGTFDDCQALVKAMLDDAAFRETHRISAMNSINWARVMAQTVYYFFAAAALGGPARMMAFSVPTGNFGDVFAGYVAARMGLPVTQLIVATNRNDILARFFEGGEYRLQPVVPTMSPSMDIQVSSNFERLLFDLYDRRGEDVQRCMNALSTEGGFKVGHNQFGAVRARFDSTSVDEAGTLAAIAGEWRETGHFVDPHTAVGIAAGRACKGAEPAPLICLATAHPAKFPDAVERATGRRPDPPQALADIMGREERYDVLPNDLGSVQSYVAARC